MITDLCKLYPSHPTLYSKTEVYRGIHFNLIFAQNIDCGYSLGPSTVLTCTHNLCFEQK